MYKIDNVRKIMSLPSHLTESNHISNFLLHHANEVKGGIGEVVRLQKLFTRTANTCVTILNINDTEVWVKEAEGEFLIEILEQVKDGRISLWYVAGSSMPFGELIRSSAMDGYEAHVLFNKK